MLLPLGVNIASDTSVQTEWTTESGKVNDINEVQEPTNVHKARRALGMIIYTNKYMLTLAGNP